MPVIQTNLGDVHEPNPVPPARYALMNRLFALVAALAVFGCPGWESSGLAVAQSATRGTITGTVTVDQGQVRGFRVRARNTGSMIWYVVFTKDGKYTVPQALPGPYEISVLQDGYTSPIQKIALAGDQTRTVNLALTKQPEIPSNVVSKTFEEMYPPGPGLDLLQTNCLGCHGPDAFNAMRFTEAGYRDGLRRMMNGPFNLGGTVPPLAHTPITKKQQDLMVQYLVTHFGPDSPNQRLKKDPYPIDEDALAKAIYVQYEFPSDISKTPVVEKPTTKQAQGTGQTTSTVSVTNRLIAQRQRQPDVQAWLHDPYIDKDGTIWFANPPGNSIVHLDPHGSDGTGRWKVFPLPADAPPYVFLHGITVDSTGKVYWAEIIGGKIGELDPKTGAMKRYELPTFGSILQVVVDQKDNVWYNQVHGDGLGKLDAQTRQISQYPTLTPDVGVYGLAVDQKGNVWSPGWTKSMVVKFDPVTEEYTEYKAPTPGGSARRLGVDSKGIVWFSEWTAGKIASIDPESGKITEYTPQVRSRFYETWPDKLDNVWASEDFNNSMVYFDRKTNKFTYYPLPQVWKFAGVPKIEIEPNNTVWIGSRTTEYTVAIHFYPNGYSAEAPPLP